MRVNIALNLSCLSLFEEGTTANRLKIIKIENFVSNWDSNFRPPMHIAIILTQSYASCSHKKAKHPDCWWLRDRWLRKRRSMGHQFNRLWLQFYTIVCAIWQKMWSNIVSKLIWQPGEVFQSEFVNISLIKGIIKTLAK